MCLFAEFKSLLNYRIKETFFILLKIRHNTLNWESITYAKNKTFMRFSLFYLRQKSRMNYFCSDFNILRTLISWSFHSSALWWHQFLWKDLDPLWMNNFGITQRFILQTKVFSIIWNSQSGDAYSSLQIWYQISQRYQDVSYFVM